MVFGSSARQEGTHCKVAVFFGKLTVMRFLLNLPIGISFFIVSAVTTAVALAGLHFVRKKYSTEVLKVNHELAAIIFNAFALLYGEILPLVVFVTWSRYDVAGE